MTNVATFCSLLLGYETCRQYRFLEYPEDEWLATCWWRVITFDMSAGSLVLGKYTFMVDH